MMVTNLSMKEQRNELEDSYWTEVVLPNYTMSIDGRDRIEIDDNDENNPYDGNPLHRVLNGNSSFANYHDDTGYQTPTKDAKKDKKNGKRFKIFGAMRKSNGKKREQIKSVLGNSNISSDSVYDFSVLGHRRFVKDIQKEFEEDASKGTQNDTYCLDSCDSELHEQLVKNDTFNSTWRTEESVNSIPSDEYLDNRRSQSDVNRSRSQSTVRSTARYKNNVYSVQDPLQKIPNDHRSRSQSTQRSKAISKSSLYSGTGNNDLNARIAKSRSRSQSTGRSLVQSNTNGSSIAARKIHTSNLGSRSQSTHRSRSNSSNRLPLRIDISNSYHELDVVKPRKSLSMSRSMKDEDRHDVHTLRRAHSRSRCLQNNDNDNFLKHNTLKKHLNPNSIIPRHRIGLLAKGGNAKVIDKMCTQTTKGKIDNSGTNDIDDMTEISDLSELSMTGPKSNSNKYLQNLLSMTKLDCHGRLEKVIAPHESHFFCTVSKMNSQESDSDDSSYDSSTATEHIFVDITVDNSNLLPTTSSLSSESTDISEDENENDEDSDFSTDSTLPPEPEAFQQCEDPFQAGTMFTFLRTKLTDCFVPTAPSPSSNAVFYHHT